MKNKKNLTAMFMGIIATALVFTACKKPAEESKTNPTPTLTIAPTTDVSEDISNELPDEPIGEPSMTDGIFETRFTPPGYDEYVNYFHFYPSGIFYYSAYNGGQSQAGYYEVVDVETGYEHEDGSTGTAPQALVLTNLDGSEFFTLAYDGETIFGVPFLYLMDFTHVPDSDHKESDENGITIIEFILGDDVYSTVSLKHNSTFQDAIFTIIEGTWTREGDVYYLTDADSLSTYTLTLEDGGSTAVYNGLDGQTETLNLVKEAEVMLSLSGSVEAAYGTMSAVIKCYDGGELEMLVNYAGTDNTLTGTWQLADTMANISLNIDGVDYDAPLNYEDRTFSFDYITTDGTQDVTLMMSSGDSVSIQYIFTGENISEVTLEMYSDGTCALIFAGMGTVTEGIWSADTTGPLPAWTINLNETFEDMEIVVETDYATKFFFTFKNAGGTLEETLALSFADFQAAN